MHMFFINPASKYAYDIITLRFLIVVPNHLLIFENFSDPPPVLIRTPLFINVSVFCLCLS